MALRATFIDRDGTINFDKGHVFRAKDFEYIPRALAALKLLTDREVEIYIVTNQAGIAKGLYTERDFAALTRTMLGQMADHGIVVADVLFCPHHPDAVDPAYRIPCKCRKPEPGLLRQVIDTRRFLPEDLAMIGDKNSDIEAGRAVGATTYLVETGYGSNEKEATKADHVVSDLHAAVTHLLRKVG
jgi:D-glycero-D-manno-heptose 1,7-bisphosphate phosphatase